MPEEGILARAGGAPTAPPSMGISQQGGGAQEGRGWIDFFKMLAPTLLGAGLGAASGGGGKAALFGGVKAGLQFERSRDLEEERLEDRTRSQGVQDIGLLSSFSKLAPDAQRSGGKLLPEHLQEPAAATTNAQARETHQGRVRERSALEERAAMINTAGGEAYVDYGSDPNMPGVVRIEKQPPKISTAKPGDVIFKTQGGDVTDTIQLGGGSTSKSRKEIMELFGQGFEASAKKLALDSGDVEMIEDFVNVKAKQDLEEISSRMKDATDLRKEFTKNSQDFITLRDSIEKVRISNTNPTAQTDLALIFSYMKILDPTSVVRESEYAEAARAGSFGEKIQGAFARAISGKKLADTQRAGFIRAADRIFQSQVGIHNRRVAEYERIATKMGVDPADVTDPMAPAAVGVDPETSGDRARFDELLSKAQTNGGELEEAEAAEYEQLGRKLKIQGF